jgi:hypothetical protein
MVLGCGRFRAKNIRFWLVVVLLVVLALCGVHLFVLYHDGDVHAVVQSAHVVGLVMVVAIAFIALSLRCSYSLIIPRGAICPEYHLNSISHRTASPQVFLPIRI